MKNWILNTTYATLHPREHLPGGFSDYITDMLAGREPLAWPVLRHCPVCTVAGLWAWIKERPWVH
jgi:hypothetical protein